MSATIDPAFAAEIARTLRDEIGARALYGRLARGERDRELASLLHAFVEQGDGIERSVRALMHGLGAQGRETSILRRGSAHFWGISARVGLRRLVLRLCLESEEVIARRYSGFAHALAGSGRLLPARECEGLAAIKVRRASALRAWVPN